MDKRVYLLAVVSFVVGMVELLIGGILDLIAEDLGVSYGQAGLLISVFSLVFAVAAPILLYMTAKVERTRLSVMSLCVFLIGNLVAIFSTTYGMLVLSRIILALSGSLLTVLCITLAANIVQPHYQGRAIGLVVMGISGSIVMGIPIGVAMGHAFGWRSPFVLIAGLTIVLIIGVQMFMGRVAPKRPVPIGKQLATLKHRKILFAQGMTFFFLAGHFTLYGYLTPFVKTTLGVDGSGLTLVYFLFGIAAVIGGGFGGMSADRFGIKPTLLTIVVLLSIFLFTVPHLVTSFPVFLVMLVIWGVLSWAITPPVQSHLIQAAPETSDIQQSLNNSAIHFGIAFGTWIGSIVIDHASVIHNASVGGVLVLMALLAALVALR